MKKFLVERFIPEIGKQPHEKLLKGIVKGTEILDDMGDDILWVESYVMHNRLYCVYLAKNEEMLREYVKRSGRPCNCIGEVLSTLEPSMLENQSESS